MADKNVVDLVNLKVVPNLEDEYKQIDILTIIEIAFALIGLFKECKDLREKLEKDSSKIMKTINNPNAINKVRLYLALRRQCKGDGTQRYLNAIVKAVLEAGKTATKEDVETLCNATLPSKLA